MMPIKMSTSQERQIRDAHSLQDEPLPHGSAILVCIPCVLLSEIDALREYIVSLKQSARKVITTQRRTECVTHGPIVELHPSWETVVWEDARTATNDLEEVVNHVFPIPNLPATCAK